MKSAKNDPLKPSRSDYQILKKILESSYSVLHIPAEYDLIIAVFGKAGGKWGRVFEGDSEQIRLLKRVVKVAYKNEYLTRAPKWK